MESTDFLLINIKDDIVFELDGSTKKVKVITFRLGKTGPYTERMSPEEFLAGDLNARVALLQAQLRALPQ